MSQYGKPEYWDERYTRYLTPNPETQNLSIGINASADSRILSQPISIRITRSSMSEQATLDSAKKCWRKATQISPTLISAGWLWRQWPKNTRKSKKIWSIFKWMSAPWNSTKTTSMRSSTKPPSTLFWYDIAFIQCGENSTTNANKMISEIYRVLKKTGVYIIVSYGQPEYRLNYLEKPEYEWTVKVQQIPKPTITSSVSIASEDKDTPNVHYVYVCRKGGWCIDFESYSIYKFE